jgi:hypothetical protein
VCANRWWKDMRGPNNRAIPCWQPQPDKRRFSADTVAVNRPQVRRPTEHDRLGDK